MLKVFLAILYSMVFILFLKGRIEWIVRRVNRNWWKEYLRIQRELSEMRGIQWRDDRGAWWTWRNIERHFGHPFIWPIRVIGWKCCDWWAEIWRYEKEFTEYGVHLYEGRQGAGKSVSMQERARELKRIYPRCIIVANYGCKWADHQMTSWEDFFTIRNGVLGTVFMIDEIATQWDSNSFKDFPPELLREFTQQRKQRMVVITSSQKFMRLVKPIREQAFTVITCKTLFGRLGLQTAYDAFDYEMFHDTEGESKLKPLWRKTYLQDNELRNSFDSYVKIEMMQRDGFVPREMQYANLEEKKRRRAR